jgi:hypothetical protein
MHLALIGGPARWSCPHGVLVRAVAFVCVASLFVRWSCPRGPLASRRAGAAALERCQVRDRTRPFCRAPDSGFCRRSAATAKISGMRPQCGSRAWSAPVGGACGSALVARREQRPSRAPPHHHARADQGHSHGSRANARGKEIQPRAFALDRRGERASGAERAARRGERAARRGGSAAWGAESVRRRACGVGSGGSGARGKVQSGCGEVGDVGGWEGRGVHLAIGDRLGGRPRAPSPRHCPWGDGPLVPIFRRGTLAGDQALGRLASRPGVTTREQSRSTSPWP